MQRKAETSGCTVTSLIYSSGQPIGELCISATVSARSTNCLVSWEPPHTPHRAVDQRSLTHNDGWECEAFSRDAQGLKNTSCHTHDHYNKAAERWHMQLSEHNKHLFKWSMLHWFQWALKELISKLSSFPSCVHRVSCLNHRESVMSTWGSCLSLEVQKDDMFCSPGPHFSYCTYCMKDLRAVIHWTFI